MTNRKPPKNAVQRAGEHAGPPSHASDRRQVAISGDAKAQRLEGFIEQRIAPLPAPEELRAYRDLDERLYNAIVDDFVEEGKLRREIVRRTKSLDEKVIPRLVWLDLLGVVLGAGVVGYFLWVVLQVAGAGGDSAKLIAVIAAALAALPSIIRQFRGGRVRIKDKPDASDTEQ